MPPTVPTAVPVKLLERVQLSLTLAFDLGVSDAAAVLGELATHGSATSLASHISISQDLSTRVADVLSRTEAIIRADRPHWAAPIREELALLGVEQS